MGGTAAGAALVLAALGVHGVIAFIVATRTREIAHACGMRQIVRQWPDAGECRDEVCRRFERARKQAFALKQPQQPPGAGFDDRGTAALVSNVVAEGDSSR